MGLRELPDQVGLREDQVQMVRPDLLGKLVCRARRVIKAYKVQGVFQAFRELRVVLVRKDQGDNRAQQGPLALAGLVDNRAQQAP